MQNLPKYLLVLTILLSLPACKWSLEPLPASYIAVEPSGASLEAMVDYHMNYEGTHDTLFKEVWLAESERSSLKMDKNSLKTLVLKLKKYKYEEGDSLDLVPGVLVPGMLPFGPLGFWWIYEDLSVDTPSLAIVLIAEVREKGNNSNDISRLNVNVEVTRGITTEDNLARTGFALATIKVLEWLEDNKK